MGLRKQHYDGIPVELFQILKDAAVKVLHSICQQIWKTQQWPQDWKRSVFIPMPKKGNVKECSNYHTIALISHASKVMLKILQARLQQYVNHELPDVQVGFRKGKGEKERYTHLNAEFQRIARRDKKAFLSDKCKEIEESNRMAKTRELCKKTRDTKGTFYAMMGTIKDRNGMDLTEAEDMKKRWKEYTEEVYRRRSFLYSSFVYSCHLFLISSASVRSIPFLSFIVPIIA